MMIPQKNAAQHPAYPETKKVQQADDYFGTVVEDPYRWLEDDTAAETEAWVRKQNAVTESYLSKIPFRQKVRERMTRLWNYEKRTAPVRYGEDYYYFANNGLQDQFELKRMHGINGAPETMIDPNKLSAGGTTHLNDYSVSKDGKYLAYSISSAGSDWNEIRVMDAKSKKVLGDRIRWVKFSGISWYGDGFFYSRFDAPAEGQELKGKNEFHKVYFHKVGTAQDADSLVFEDKEHPLRNFSAVVSHDRKYLVVYASESTHGNEVYVKNLAVPGSDFVTVCSGFEAENGFVGNTGKWLYILTNRDAPRYTLLAFDAEMPAITRVILPENADVLEGVAMSKGRLVTQYMKDASSRLRVYSTEGQFLSDIPLPSLGDVNELSADPDDDNIFYAYLSFTSPPTLFRYQGSTGTSSVFFKPPVQFADSAYVTEEVFYPSRDGTQIPMFLTYRKGLKRDGNNPVLLYGYGGFNISRKPEYKIERLVFLENGGVFAAPCLRGGGEYGEEWHQAGTKLNKQNVFDDFIAAAEYLVSEQFTQPGKIAISGRSNGGLLVGACMTQRPDLFKVALPAVGVMDMLRYHTFTIGWAWKGDYGSSEDPENFKNLYSYSPLHTIREGVPYPATLVTTGDHDDRVVPAHSFKFIATLQEKYKGPEPVLIRVDINSGHASTTITGSSKPVSKQIDEMTDVFSFTMHNLGMTVR